MTTEQYISEVLSRMDYEDKIGDTTFRFKYRNVVPCNYGLTVDEVLNAPDRELNSWVSVKKMSQYRTEQEEQLDVKLFKKKSSDVKKKLNILPSLRNDSSVKEEDNTTILARKSQSLLPEKQKKNGCKKDTAVELMKKTKLKSSEGNLQSINTIESTNDQTEGKKRKRKNKGVVNNGIECKTPRLEILDECDTESKPSQIMNSSNEEKDIRGMSSEAKIVDEKDSAKQKKKKKRRSTVPTMSSDRLAAYGINERKFKYVIQNKLHQEMKKKQQDKKS